MSDIADMANRQLLAEQDEQAAKIKAAADAIPTGEPGECSTCGEFTPRLVNEMCCPCRDKYGVE